jgi:FkbM family methyltransferase
MAGGNRKAAFVLVSTNHGAMILNRLDYQIVEGNRTIGVGSQLLDYSTWNPQELGDVTALLGLRRKYYGDGVFAVDCGANIGLHTIEWATTMTGWGSVLAIEAQERLFYALAGNIALNNCFNARAIHAAVAAQKGTLRIPAPDYLRPANFGGLSLKPFVKNESIGQDIDYAGADLAEINTITLDSLESPRLDLIKIDVEGMEEEVLAGAARTLSEKRPILHIEWIKSSKERISEILQRLDYAIFAKGINLVAIHKNDPCLGHVKQT